MLTVLSVDPVGELAEGSRVAWGWLVDARGVGVELKPIGNSSADLFTWVVVPPALRVELAWKRLVDTRRVGTVPGLTDGSSLAGVLAAVGCLVVSRVWRDGENPKKAKGSQRHVKMKHSLFSSCVPVN